MTLTSSSMASSIANTPRSGESFNLPVFQNPSRVNPATGLSDEQEESLFEAIFLALSRAYDSALQALPIARKQFARCAEIAEEDRKSKEVREVWSNLLWRCKACLDVSETLHLRLINMKVKDSSTNSGRNNRSFWQLTKSFTQSFIDLVAEMKEAKSLRLLAQDIIVILRPVQKASREAVRLIDASPWAYLTEAGSQPPAVPPLPHPPPPPVPLITNGAMNGYFNKASHSGHLGFGHSFQQSFHPHHLSNTSPHTQQQQQQQFLQRQQPPPSSSVQSAMQAVSPDSATLPATPLSAALGPAAQATIPSTPASAYGGDPAFRGESFVRPPPDGGFGILPQQQQQQQQPPPPPPPPPPQQQQQQQLNGNMTYNTTRR
jgi:RAM signalling pathway protein